MSFITSVLLTLSAEEETSAEGEVVLVGQLNDWLLARCQARLRNVGKFAGGRSRFTSPLYAGTFNHLPTDPVDGVIAFVKRLPWRRLESVQLFFKPQHLERYAMIYFVTGGVAEIRGPRTYNEITAKILGDTR